MTVLKFGLFRSTCILFPKNMEYLKYTQEDASIDGIGYTISHYSTKAVDGNEVKGIIVFEDRPLNINDTIITQSIDEEAKRYYENLKKAKSIYLRKLIFKGDRYSGELEDFFGYVTERIVPHDYIIWCNLQLDIDNFVSYITQIGGFNEPLYSLPNKNILIFSINK